MLILKSKGIIPNIPEYYFIADTEADLADLPKENIPVGSNCLCLNPVKVLVCNSKNEWVEL